MQGALRGLFGAFVLFQAHVVVGDFLQGANTIGILHQQLLGQTNGFVVFAVEFQHLHLLKGFQNMGRILGVVWEAGHRKIQLSPFIVPYFG